MLHIIFFELFWISQVCLPESIQTPNFYTHTQLDQCRHVDEMVRCSIESSVAAFHLPIPYIFHIQLYILLFRLFELTLRHVSDA